MTLLLWGAAVILVVIGVIGVFVPVLPGPLLVFAGLVTASWAEQFRHVGWAPLIVIGVLAVIGSALDFAAAAVGTRRFGASWWGVGGAAVGTVVGFFFGVVGILLGPFLGAVLGEAVANRGMQQAGRAGLGAWLGVVLGLGAKLAAVFAMLAIFALARIW